MGHPQPPTLICTDNKTASGILNGTMKQKRSKAIDMRFHWLKQKATENKEITVTWAPGSKNLADYTTKHHSPSHHIRVRPIYLYVPGKSQDRKYISWIFGFLSLTIKTH